MIFLLGYDWRDARVCPARLMTDECRGKSGWPSTDSDGQKEKPKQQNEPLQQFKVTASTVGPSFPKCDLFQMMRLFWIYQGNRVRPPLKPTLTVAQ